MEGEDGESAPSTPVTPGAPPLFGGFRNGNRRQPSLLRSSCKCFNVESWSLEDGPLPPLSCSFPSPPISLARKAIFEPMMGGGVTVPGPTVGYAQAFALEFIVTFNLMFVVTAVATDTRAVGELAVGATVMLNILIAGESTGASMNPVRTLGPAVAANNYRAIWVYLTAPILGALARAGVYTAVKLPDEGGDKPLGEHSFRR
ncbi:hypothetical protein SASPL_110294 [Salvia splendens]|uniref:Aquaporin NIP n=1 Tax=Salvia splendens TaxID=180675 RepID=A0A8X8Y9P8_SALSN|nr:hypothetical protein SASPL_110294 [Salvia splendens]